MRRFEVATPEWMDAMVEAVDAEVGAEAFAERYALVEAFRDLPRHIAPNQGATFAWHVLVDAAGLDVGPGGVPDPDLRIVMTHALASELGTLAYEDAESLARRDDIYARATIDGSVVFERGAEVMPPPLAAALLRAHNRMAPQTI